MLRKDLEFIKRISSKIDPDIVQQFKAIKNIIRRHRRMSKDVHLKNVLENICEAVHITQQTYEIELEARR